MSIKRGLFIGFILAILVALLTPLFLPKHFSIQRSITINTPDTTVFNNIVNLRNWKNWSAWYQIEDGKIDFYGKDGWENSQMNWNGTKVGVGSLQVLNAKKHSFIKMRYSFYKPYNFDSDMDFIIQQVDKNKTEITWKNFGYLNYFLRFAKLKFFGDKDFFEERVGTDFEDSLNNLKRQCENQ